MTGVVANHKNFSSATYNLARVADPFHTGTHFHLAPLTLDLLTNPDQTRTINSDRKRVNIPHLIIYWQVLFARINLTKGELKSQDLIQS